MVFCFPYLYLFKLWINIPISLRFLFFIYLLNLSYASFFFVYEMLAETNSIQ